MRFREWFRGALQPAGGEDPPPAANLEEVRHASQELLKAGQAAIDKALSGNSQTFLAATRQDGGQ